MKILYIANLVSPTFLKEVQAKGLGNVSPAVQKFNSLVVEGFMLNGEEVTVLSSFFCSNGNLFWHHRKEQQDDVTYRYIPSFTVSFIRYVWLLAYGFFFVLFWGLLCRKNKTVFCDVLNVSICAGAVAAARLLGLKNVGVMTDMPGMMVARQKTSCWKSLGRLNERINKCYLNKFTHYVFLTEMMNEVNTRNRPYIVMEGLVKHDLQIGQCYKKDDSRTIFYAGGLHARYGLQMLINAVKTLPHKDIRLVLYGNGPIVAELENEKDPRIVYRGLAPNDVIVEEEKRAILLVNPRPTHEDFTKYSFPSKNMEYMVSGTPLLTTLLPGMPREYYPYVYLFDKGESTEGYAEVLNNILSKSQEELNAKGGQAQQWILAHKNNIIQSARIIELISDKNDN